MTDMPNDKILLHRFMSREEYVKYLSGEVLHNSTDLTSVLLQE